MAYTMIHANKCDLAINALKQEDIYYCHNCSTPTTTGFAIAIVTTEIVTHVSLHMIRMFGIRLMRFIFKNRFKI